MEIQGLESLDDKSKQGEYSSHSFINHCNDTCHMFSLFFQSINRNCTISRQGTKDTCIQASGYESEQ